MFYKKYALKNFAKFTGKDLCQSLFLNQVKGLIFSSEFCEIFKNTSVLLLPYIFLSKDFICKIAYFTVYSSLVFSLFYASQVYKNYLLFGSGDTMYLSRIFSRIFTWFLRRKDATPTKSLLLCNSLLYPNAIITFE